MIIELGRVSDLTKGQLGIRYEHSVAECDDPDLLTTEANGNDCP